MAVAGPQPTPALNRGYAVITWARFWRAQEDKCGGWAGGRFGGAGCDVGRLQKPPGAPAREKQPSVAGVDVSRCPVGGAVAGSAARVKSGSALFTHLAPPPPLSPQLLLN